MTYPSCLGFCFIMSSLMEGSKRPNIAACCLALLLFCISGVESQTTTSPQPGCSSFRNCDTCVPNPKCLWCFSTNNCTEYPVSWLLPPASVCRLSEARWAVCWLNFEALVVTVGVLGGIIILSFLVCCCYCCCCRRRQSRRPDYEEEFYARRREEMRQRADDRKFERMARHEDIRRKYGLMGDSDHPYSKFENE
ncbi:pituitary tumor-transforming gene 1 protein-interacting protein isoform X1 [Synchiropus splendidus]|uniref:pituitary tumor-transforming gene 1 protein-interacting protein isoform X1 n=1 Tax=Synchiropus splendidus TaxID=270530 RepID=UPI00237D7E7D|nr:pituitary tumor-transforming gene 1 protein-interacting protein isoform X1 [Synchiropus splendidus]